MNWILFIAVLTSSGFVSIETTSSYTSKDSCRLKAYLINRSGTGLGSAEHKEIRAYCKEE